MKKFFLFTCLVIMVLGFTLSTVAEKEENKYYEKDHCGTGYACKVNDCGIKKKGYGYNNALHKGWGHVNKCESGYGYKKKKGSDCCYRKSDYCGVCDKRHHGKCRRDGCCDNYYNKGCYKPYRKCDNDYKECGKGYRNYRETSIGCAAPK